MYCPYFGFREDPFGISPDPRFFFPSAQHTEASAALYYAIAQRRGFACAHRGSGLGKNQRPGQPDGTAGAGKRGLPSSFIRDSRAAPPWNRSCWPWAWSPSRTR